MHLADIQSVWESKSMTLELLESCSSVWATGGPFELQEGIHAAQTQEHVEHGSSSSNGFQSQEKQKTDKVFKCT